MGRKSVDKPDIDVMSGFFASMVHRITRSCVNLRAFGFSDVPDVIRISSEILIANALLFMIIGMLLVIISRVMNAKIFRS
jgi:hypothetical protein